MMDTNLFVPDQNDILASFIENVIGGANGALHYGILDFNLVCTAIGGTIFLFFAVRAIIDSATHGQIGGKHTGTWFPIRFCVCIGLLLPLPIGNGGNGFNAAELIWLAVPVMGSGAADKVWTSSINSTKDMSAAVEPIMPEIDGLARHVFLSEFCMAMQNTIAATSNAPTIELHTSHGAGSIMDSYDGVGAGGIIGQCGTIKYNLRPNTASTNNAVISGNDAAAAAVYNVHIDKTAALRDALRPLAQALAPWFLPPYAEPAGGAPLVDLHGIEQSYSTAVEAIAKQQIIQAEAARLEKYADAATEGGWVRAGAWSLNLVRTNETVQDAVSGLPTVTPPHAEWWEGGPYGQGKAALAGAEHYWHQHYGNARATTDDDAYSASINRSDVWAFSDFIDVTRYKRIFDTVLLGWSGDNSTDLTGSHQRNAITELSALGHNLIDSVIGSWVLFANARGVAAAAKAGGEALVAAGSATPIVGSVFGAAMSGVVSAAAFILEQLGALAIPLYLLTFSLFSAALGLAFFVPIIPGVTWLYAVVQYVAMTLAGTIGAPLWAIAHLEMEGEGLGQRAQTGYLALLGMLVRPAAMILMLIFSMVVLQWVTTVFGLYFYPMVRNANAGSWGGAIGLVTYLVIGTGIIVALIWACMWLITHGTDYAMGFIGERFSSSQLVNEGTSRTEQPTKKGADDAGNKMQTGSLREPREPSTHAENVIDEGKHIPD